MSDVLTAMMVAFKFQDVFFLLPNLDWDGLAALANLSILLLCKIKLIATRLAIALIWLP